MYGPQPSQELSYAPTPYGFTPSTSFSSRINVDAEVKLADTSAEHNLIDSLAEIYSIIRTLDNLEKAYIKDALSQTEFTELYSKLLKQYKSTLHDEEIAREFVDIDTFVRKWSIECPRAVERLRSGILPDLADARPVNPTNPPPTHFSGSLILAATENFITFLDALRLNMVTKSALHPLLSEVIQSVNRVTDQDFQDRGKIIQWLITLNQMKTSEELSEEQARDLGFDMEQAYNGFKSIIH